MPGNRRTEFRVDNASLFNVIGIFLAFVPQGGLRSLVFTYPAVPVFFFFLNLSYPAAPLSPFHGQHLHA